MTWLDCFIQVVNRTCWVFNSHSSIRFCFIDQASSIFSQAFCQKTSCCSTSVLFVWFFPSSISKNVLVVFIQLCLVICKFLFIFWNRSCQSCCLNFVIIVSSFNASVFNTCFFCSCESPCCNNICFSRCKSCISFFTSQFIFRNNCIWSFLSIFSCLILNSFNISRIFWCCCSRCCSFNSVIEVRIWNFSNSFSCCFYSSICFSSSFFFCSRYCSDNRCITCCFNKISTWFCSRIWYGCISISSCCYIFSFIRSCYACSRESCKQYAWIQCCFKWIDFHLHFLLLG